MKELQIISAPFDVRYGNFAGGLINAVTRSGTNRVEGSILGYFENADLSGTDSTGSRGERVQPQGVRADPRRARSCGTASPSSSMPPCDGRSSPRRCPPRAATPRVEPIRSAWASAMRAWCVSRTSCGATASSREPSRPGRPARRRRNLFAKVTAQLGVNSRLEVSHNYGHGNDRTGDRRAGTMASIPLLDTAARSPRPSMRPGSPGPRPSVPASPTS